MKALISEGEDNGPRDVPGINRCMKFINTESHNQLAYFCTKPSFHFSISQTFEMDEMTFLRM